MKISEEYRQALEQQRREALQRPPIPELTEYQILLTTPEGERTVYVKAHDKNIVDGALCFMTFYYPTNMHSKPGVVITKTYAAGRWAEVTEQVPESVYISEPIQIVG